VSSEGRPQHLIVIFGPPGSGKDTIAQQIAEQLDFSLANDLMFTEFASTWFDSSDTAFWTVVPHIRQYILTAIARSYNLGLVIPYTWDFDISGDREYIEKLSKTFDENKWTIHFVELRANLTTRMKRMTDLSSLSTKEIESIVMESADYRYNSEGQFPLNYELIEINTDKTTIEENVAEILSKIF
jgi:cytidylate kinase